MERSRRGMICGSDGTVSFPQTARNTIKSPVRKVRGFENRLILQFQIQTGGLLGEDLINERYDLGAGFYRRNTAFMNVGNHGAVRFNGTGHGTVGEVRAHGFGGAETGAFTDEQQDKFGF